MKSFVWFLLWCFDAVISKLAASYHDQQMFTEAESLHQKRLSLLDDMPGIDTEEIGTGQNY